MAKKKTRRRPIRFEDLMGIERISQTRVSPDGRYAVYTVTVADHIENEMRHTLRLIDLASGDTRNITPGPGNHNQAAWSPNGKWLAFVSTRGESADAQVWVMPTNGGEARQVTTGWGGANHPVWSPRSKRIAFSRSVVVTSRYKGTEDPRKATAPDRAEVFALANRKSTARTADRLLFRHWDRWTDCERNHVMIVDVRSGRIGDVTPHDCDAPPISLGSEIDYAFSPKGNEIAFVMNPDAIVARSTNNSIFVQKIRGTRMDGAASSISTSEACDTHPRYSSDGKTIYYLGMDVPGYEADRRTLKAYDRKSGETEVHAERFDRNPDRFEITDDGSIVLIAHDRGRQSIYRYDPAKRAMKQLTLDTYNGSFAAIPGSRDLLVTRETTTEPADLYRLTPGSGIAPFTKSAPAPKDAPADAGATVAKLTDHAASVAHIDFNPAEEFWYTGADKDPVHGFLIKPPRWVKGKKYPLVLLIHGGPQSAFADHFHYRWSAQMFAKEGAVVAFFNPRGSTGYGQKFSDQISGDWGGRCYEDIEKGVDYILKKYPFIDPKRMTAAGASFGGFMINWIAGHSNRYRALACHDGIFQAETMGYTTEELWFEQHEHGGMPHEARKSFLKFSPHLHVENFQTPTLVVHGEQDFRCPISEGLAMFTALQVKGVPSRLLTFPDEGHWVLKPANAEVWYEEMIGWLMKFA